MGSKRCSELRLRLRSLDLDKYIEYPDDKEVWPELKLTNGDFERAVIQLFMIDIMAHIETKAALAKNLRIQPSEIDRMAFWEYEYFFKSLNNMLKEENDRQEKEMAKYGIKDTMSMANPKNISKMMSSATPKMPQMPSFGSMNTSLKI